MSEIVDRIVKSRRPYKVIGRSSGPGKTTEWFIDWDQLVAGKFVAGPFDTQEEALAALEAMNARAALAAIRRPTSAMVLAAYHARSGGPQRPDFREEWAAAIDEALK